MLSELARRCMCGAIVDDPAAFACPACSKALVPHHTTWPMVAKWFGLSELGRERMHPWLTEQQGWEQILRDAMVGGGQGPNPRGVEYTTLTPVAGLYPAFVVLAHEWKDGGSIPARALGVPARKY